MAAAARRSSSVDRPAAAYLFVRARAALLSTSDLPDTWPQMRKTYIVLAVSPLTTKALARAFNVAITL